MGARVYGGPKWTVSPVYEGMLKEEMDAAAERHPEVVYQPVLIDATYAGLLTGATETPLVIPALNRDGDCLSDMVLPMFGSIAGAESVLLAFDDDYERRRRDGRGAARHGAVADGQGPREPDGDAAGLRRGAELRRACAGRAGAERASRAIYEGVLETVATGTKTIDLGGHATTSEFTDAVVEKVRTKVDVWSSLARWLVALERPAPARVEHRAGRPARAVPATTIETRLRASWASEPGQPSRSP